MLETYRGFLQGADGLFFVESHLHVSFFTGQTLHRHLVTREEQVKNFATFSRDRSTVLFALNYFNLIADALGAIEIISRGE